MSSELKRGRGKKCRACRKIRDAISRVLRPKRTKK